MAEPLLDQAASGSSPQLKAVTHKSDSYTLDQANEVTAFIGSLRPVFSRALLYIVLLFVVVALLWAWYGKVDVVASAPFRLVPLGQVTAIQAPRNGEVDAIVIEEGDLVSKGQVLVKLQSPETLAELQTLEQVRVAYQKADYDLRVALPKKQALMRETLSVLEERLVLLQAFIVAQHEVVTSYQKEASDSELDFGFEDASDLQTQIGLRQTTIDYLKTQYERQKKLFEHGLISRANLEQAQLLYVNALTELPARLGEIYKQEQEIQDLKRQILETRLEMNREAALIQNAYDQTRLQLTQAQKKIDRSLDDGADLVVAQASGVVTQVLVNATGQVVGKGQVLVTIAPASEPIVAEVNFLNKDVGLIAPGQSVKLKYDAFPFQDFGIKQGRLKHLAPDMVMDDMLGPVFRGIVTLDESVIQVKDGTVPLRFGMMGVAEVVTDRQPILMTLLSPLRKLQKSVVFSEKEGLENGGPDGSE